eukprot:tig00021070_g17901.t1
MTPSQRVYAASTDPTTKLVFGRKNPVVDTSKRIKLDPELEPVSLQLVHVDVKSNVCRFCADSGLILQIGAEPGSTLSVNDVMWVAITFDGVIVRPKLNRDSVFPDT